MDDVLPTSLVQWMCPAVNANERQLIVQKKGTEGWNM
jgi:hypothetical protein